MVGRIQPLAKEFEIVGPDGKPTDYFIRWAQERQIDIAQGISAAEAQQLIDDWAAARDIVAGVALDGGGNLSADVTLDYAGGIADQSDVDLSTPPADGQVLVWNDGASMWVPADQSGGGGGGGLTLIGTQTLAVGAASVTFGSIPQDYKDLVLVWSLRGDTAVANTDFFARLNGDTGANYDYEFVHWFATGSSINQSTGQTAGRIASITAGSATASHASVGRLEIPNYTDTTFFKGAFSDFFSSLGTGGFSQGRGLYGFNWRSTAAVTSITVFPSAGNIIAGSTVSLYGRPAASVVGGSSAFFSGGTGEFGSVNTGARATKGVHYKPDRSVTLSKLWAVIDAAATSETFYAQIATVNPSTGTITAVVATGSTIVATSTNPEYYALPFSVPVRLTSGLDYVLLVVRADGSGTSVLRLYDGDGEFFRANAPGTKQVGRWEYNTIGVSAAQATSASSTATGFAIWPEGDITSSTGGGAVWGPSALSGSGVLGSAFATHGMVFKPFVDITITGFTCYQQIAAGNTYRFFIAPMSSVSLDTDNHTLTGGTLGTEMYSQAFTNPTTANQTRVIELTTPQVLTAGTAYTIGIQRTDSTGTAVSQSNWTTTEYGSYGFPGEVYRRLYNINNSGSLSGLSLTSIDTGTANALSLWPFGIT